MILLPVYICLPFGLFHNYPIFFIFVLRLPFLSLSFLIVCLLTCIPSSSYCSSSFSFDLPSSLVFLFIDVSFFFFSSTTFPSYLTSVHLYLLPLVPLYHHHPVNLPFSLPSLPFIFPLSFRKVLYRRSLPLSSVSFYSPPFHLRLNYTQKKTNTHTRW